MGVIKMNRVKHRLLILFLWIFSITIYMSSGLAAPIPSPPKGLSISSGPVNEITPPPSPFGNEGLLSGMTPSKYSLPSGWSLIRTQDFESGSLRSDEYSSGEVTGAGEKRGKYSLRGLFDGDADELHWMIDTIPNSTGSFTEIYMSYYEWTDSNARWDTEWIRGSVTAGDPGVGNYWRINFNYFNTSNFNGTKMPYVIQGEGTTMDAFAHWGPTKAVPVGRWVQREFWYRPNTPIASTDPNTPANGFVRMYEDGVLVFSRENSNLNGPANMTNGAWFTVGGLYTKHIWRLADGTCSSTPGDGSGYGREMNWNNPCQCQNQCPPDGYVPIFYSVIDDIIVMRK